MKKKIKIVIAVNSSGGWSAIGFGNHGEESGLCEKMGMALNIIGKKSTFQHAEIEIDLPEILEPPPKGLLS